MIIYIVIQLEKMCSTKDKTSSGVQNDMLFLSENFSSLKSHCVFPVLCIILGRLGGKKQHDWRLLKPHQFLVDGPFSSFQNEDYLCKMLSKQSKRWNLIQQNNT